MPKLVMTGKDMLALFNIEYDQTLLPITDFMMQKLNKVLTLIIVEGDLEKDPKSG